MGIQAASLSGFAIRTGPALQVGIVQRSALIEEDEKNYERSLELNPGNTNASEKLKSLRSK